MTQPEDKSSQQHPAETAFPAAGDVTITQATRTEAESAPEKDDAYYSEVRKSLGRGTKTLLLGTSTRSLERGLSKLRAAQRSQQGSSPVSPHGSSLTTPPPTAAADPEAPMPEGAISQYLARRDIGDAAALVAWINSHRDASAMLIQVANEALSPLVTDPSADARRLLARTDELMEALPGLVTDPSSDARRLLARAHALTAGAVYWESMDRSEETVRALDEVISRYSADADPTIRVQAAMLLINKAFILEKMNRPEAAVRALDEVISRFSDDPDSAVREQVLIAQASKAERSGRRS
jgi:hypothetical protein